VAQLRREGLPVSKVVAGGTGTFPVYAAMSDPELELSPGTPVFYDAGYRECFPDLPFQVAAMLLTRVVSRPAADLVTFDLGYKACASDPPAGRRLVFPEIPDAREIRQNEEHLVIQTSLAERFGPGDAQLAIPRHICPTVALHRQVQVVSGGCVIGCWEVAARDRVLNL
jgi:D-serine deaminase-like pyridoxal phosphate-dependent protein